MNDESGARPQPRPIAQGEFLVIYPWITSEESCETEDLGYTPMIPMISLSLNALRSYLSIMVLMVFYRCLQLDLGG